MSLLLRSSLFSRAFQPQLLGLQGIMSPRILSRAVTLKAQKYKAGPVEDYDVHNMNIGRPQSPHLSVIKYQFASILSMSHRLTGVALSGYMIALGIGAMVLPNDITHYITMLDSMHLSQPVLMFIKFSLAFPLCYHWSNGIRHLVWDSGRCVNTKAIYNTGYLLVVVSSVLTAACMAL